MLITLVGVCAFSTAFVMADDTYTAIHCVRFLFIIIFIQRVILEFWHDRARRVWDVNCLLGASGVGGDEGSAVLPQYLL
jgi:hypothetical protein